MGLFAREAASADGSQAAASDRSVVTGALEPSVMMSPERKRPYDMDQSETSLVNFSDGELDDSALHTPKKSKSDEPSEPPAPIPDLPRVSEDMVSV